MLNSLRLTTAGLALALLLFGGCSESPSSPKTPEIADVNAFLDELPSWEEFSPPLPDVDEAVGSPETIEEVVGESTYECETTPYSITRTPDKIVTMNPDQEVLWPGSLLQGQGYAMGIGSLAELPIRERAPLDISIDILASDNTRRVDNPTLASVNQAIGQLIQAATDAGHSAGSNVLFTQERMHSVNQGLLKMGLSAKYKGAEVSSNLEVSYSAERTNVTAYFVQRMFTVSVVLPSTPQDFFSDGFTAAKLQEQVDRGRVGPDNLPVFVSNISYGRMLVFSLSSTANAAAIEATLNVVLESGGNGGGTELTAEQKSLMENAQIKVVTVGGDASHALALIRSGNLAEFFRTDATLTSARPISYTIRNLGDNSIAKVSETTEYSLRECTQQALEPTGAEYEITMQLLRYREFGGILNGCTGACALLTSYDYYVQDSQGQTQVAYFDPPIGPALCEGDHLQLEWNGGPPKVAKVRLHKDGLDSVKIFGTLYNVTPFVNWILTYKNQMPTGNFEKSAWSSGNCHRYSISFNVKKVGDLYD